MSEDKKARRLAAAAQAQVEMNTQINRFMEKLDKATDDPADFITMSQLVVLSQSPFIGINIGIEERT